MVAIEDTYRVEVRHPLRMRRPTAVRARHRRLTEGHKESSDGRPIFAYSGPHHVGVEDDLQSLIFSLIFWVVVILAIGALSLLLLWVLALVVVLVESAIWVASIVAGIAAVVVLRRPYSVAVVDCGTGAVLAKAQVFGRAAAERHADVVRSRLGAGLTPKECVRVWRADGDTHQS